MSKVWKWIIGILIALVVVALAVGAVFMVRNRGLMMTYRMPMTYGNNQTRPNVQVTPNAPGAPNAPGVPNGPNGYNGQKGPMMPYGFNDRHFPMNGFRERGPMMRGGGFSHFGMGFFFLGGLAHLIFPLAILALVAYIFYQMGKRAGAASAVVTAPVPAPSETPAKGRKVAKS